MEEAVMLHKLIEFPGCIGNCKNCIRIKACRLSMYFLRGALNLMEEG